MCQRCLPSSSLKKSQTHQFNCKEDCKKDGGHIVEKHVSNEAGDSLTNAPLSVSERPSC